MQGREDPGWPRASQWLRGERSAANAPRMIAVLGVPLSQASISPSGAHETPAAVRRALDRFSTFDAQVGADLEQVSVADRGDIDLAGLDNVAAQTRIQEQITELVTATRPELLMLLGGDNALTRPAVHAVAGELNDVGLLTLDAHHDVRGFHAGPTNGTPVRGLISDGLDGRNIVQIGLGDFTNSRFYRRWADEHGVTSVTVLQARAEGVGQCVARYLALLAERCRMVYVDLDVDVLDAAFAPGCPGSRPGGLFPDELYAAAFEAGRHPAVAAIDIVEVDATADPDGRTVDSAALCLLKAASGFALR